MTEWPTVALGEAASITRDGVDPRRLDQNTRYIGLEHIPAGGGEAEPATVQDFSLSSTKFAFTEHHVLFGKLRPNLGKVTRPSYSGVCSTDILPVLPGTQLSAAYLEWCLRRSEVTVWATARAAGANLPRLSPKELLKLPIPLPPLQEQRRIAAILDQADALRAKRREALEGIEELVRATYQDLVSRADTSGWAAVTVEAVAAARPNAIRTGPFGSQLLHSEFVEAGVPVLGIDNAVANEFRWGKPRFITDHKYEGLRRYTVYPGDVLITIMGTCGRCAIVPADIPTAINTKHLCCITLDSERCLPTFLWAAFLFDRTSRGYLEKQAKGAVMDGLTMGIIKRMPLRLPPFNVQRDFEATVREITRVRVIAGESMDELDALFASLQDRAFKGEL